MWLEVAKFAGKHLQISENTYFREHSWIGFFPCYSLVAKFRGGDVIAGLIWWILFKSVKKGTGRGEEEGRSKPYKNRTQWSEMLGEISQAEFNPIPLTRPAPYPN